MMTTRIQIHTRLHDGISGGGQLAESLHGVWAVDDLREAARAVRNHSSGLMDSYRAAGYALAACAEARKTGAARISVDRYSAYPLS